MRICSGRRVAEIRTTVAEMGPLLLSRLQWI